MSNCELSQKHCIPCHGGIPALEAPAIAELLAQLKNAWSINAAGHLYKAYSFKDFMAAMAFANQIADIAEQQGHHPDVTIAWGKCSVEIWTHKIDGLTESDFILAAKIDAISHGE